MKWTQQYTKGEAELSFLLRKWERMTQREIAEFQLFQDLLCVPYEIFKAALEAVLGRSVFDYEIQDNRTLIAEFNEVTI